MEKFCPDCGCNRPIEEFAFKNKAVGSRQAYCNEHRRERERNRYTRIRTTVIAKARVQSAKNRKAINDWKSQFSCVVCGEDEQCCIDFHHLDPSKKEMGINMMKNRGYSLSRVIEEAKKCTPVCSNCHRKIHAGVIEL